MLDRGWAKVSMDTRTQLDREYHKDLCTIKCHTYRLSVVVTCVSLCVSVCLCTQHMITDWICQADYVIELLTYLSVTSNKEILFADNT